MATTIAVRTRKSRRADTIAYSEMALRQNASILEYCRTSMACLGGATAGILGLTGLYGFAFYFITSFLFSVMVLIKAGSRWNNYFMSRKILFTNGFLGGLFTYVLSWTGNVFQIGAPDGINHQSFCMEWFMFISRGRNQ